MLGGVEGGVVWRVVCCVLGAWLGSAFGGGWWDMVVCSEWCGCGGCGVMWRSGVASGGWVRYDGL